MRMTRGIAKREARLIPNTRQSGGKEMTDRKPLEKSTEVH
jgi:hypothetical protein